MRIKIKIKIKYLVIILLLLFISCNKKIIYDSRIINYDYKKLDGVVIYNRSSNVIIFNLIKNKKWSLVFVEHNNNKFDITKKPEDYILTESEIISLIKEYNKLRLVYCYVDFNNMIRVISDGIDYVKIDKNYTDTIFLFNENKYEFIGNNWYVKKDDSSDMW